MSDQLWAYGIQIITLHSPTWRMTFFEVLLIGVVELEYLQMTSPCWETMVASCVKILLSSTMVDSTFWRASARFCMKLSWTGTTCCCCNRPCEDVWKLLELSGVWRRLILGHQQIEAFQISVVRERERERCPHLWHLETETLLLKIK